MQGQTDWNDSFSEESSSNTSADPLASLSNRLSPVKTRLPNHRVSIHDGSISCTNTQNNRAWDYRGWDCGESSSSRNNACGTTLDDDSEMKLTWHSSYGASSVTPAPSTATNTSFVGNHVTDIAENIQNSSFCASSSNLGTPPCSSSASVENNEPGPLFGSWGSSCKRKALEGSSGSSNSYQTTRNSPNFSSAGQLNSRSGAGTSRVRFASSSVEGITENPVPFDALYASQPQSHPISNVPPMTLPLNLNEPFDSVNEARRADMNPWNGSLSLRRGSSSRSFQLSGEVNSRSSLRNIPEYPTNVPSDTRDIYGNQIDWSFRAGPSFGGRSSSTAQLPHRNQTSQDRRRSSEGVHWNPFSRVESDSGSQMSPFSLSHLASSSSSSDERATSNHGSHRSDRRGGGFLRNRGDDSNSRNILAAVEGRHRLIRQVLSAMRRGAHLQDEDYMLIDPFVNGFAELHDQHIDMMLDVDNMSYQELLALEEHIGNVSTGLNEEKIQESMKKRKYEAVEASQEIEPCCICREDYVAGDDIGILDCRHEFHTSCIKQWLILKNICPICKNTALET